MTFTYDPTKVLGAVRLLLGDVYDTVQADVRLEDEDYATLITLSTTLNPSDDVVNVRKSTVYAAAVECGSALRAKFLRKAEGSPGPDRVQPTSRAQELANLISTFRVQAKGAIVAPAVGGTSASENASLAAQPDRVGSFARMGMMDYSG